MAGEALAGLRLNVVPKAPGFASSYWLEPIDGAGMSITGFGPKEHADKVLAARLGVHRPRSTGQVAAVRRAGAEGAVDRVGRGRPGCPAFGRVI